MRITIVSASMDNSGGFRVVATLGQQLMKRGHSVCVIAPQRPKLRFIDRVKAHLTGKEMPIEIVRCDHLGTLPAVHIDHPAPLMPADLPDADIIIGTWWETMEWIADLPIEKGAKLHLVQDYEVWSYKNSAAVDRVLNFDCPKIAISGFLYNLLVDNFNSREVYLINNAVDHNLFFADERTKQNSLTVGFTYSCGLRKGADLIIKAVTKARESYPELKVIAFGHYPPQGSIPVPEWIEFHVDPKQEDIKLLYAGCDAWLFGSRSEGFGLPILEAMACRTPVIAMPAGAAPDLLGDGAGILVGDQDWEAMAQAILDLTAMPDAAWLELSRRAHSRALENQWDIVGEKLENVLIDILERPRS